MVALERTGLPFFTSELSMKMKGKHERVEGVIKITSFPSKYRGGNHSKEQKEYVKPSKAVP